MIIAQRENHNNNKRMLGIGICRFRLVSSDKCTVISWSVLITLYGHRKIISIAAEITMTNGMITLAITIIASTYYFVVANIFPSHSWNSLEFIYKTHTHSIDMLAWFQWFSTMCKWFVCKCNIVLFIALTGTSRKRIWLTSKIVSFSLQLVTQF